VDASIVAIDGTSPQAVCVNGGSLRAQSVMVQGGALDNQGALTGTLHTQQPFSADPLHNLPTPVAASGFACPGAACPDGATVSAGRTIRLRPGRFTQSVRVLAGGTVCLDPGIYVLEARWSVGGALHQTGDGACPSASPTSDPGVLLYFAHGALQLEPGADLAALSAPSSGPHANLLYWQAGHDEVSISGARVTMRGAWYSPHGKLVLNGAGELTAPSLISGTVSVNGGALRLTR
jgi:hypothetical protein